jgi:hypothetical protein
MRCSRFQVDSPWRTRIIRAAGRELDGTASPVSGGSGSADLISISILTFS